MRQFATTAALAAALFAGAAAHPLGLATTDHTTHKPKQTVVAKAPAEKPTTPATPAPVIVTVAPGDTLSSIAAAEQTTYVRIFDANTQITDPNVIDVGWQLRIPTADEQLPDRPLPAAVTPATTTAPASTMSTVRTVAYVAAPVSDNAAKAFIYAHESGNNPAATSPNGCFGLGQDCNGRVRAQCGTDYACQDAYFDNYAASRYGSWAGAEAFWQTHGWW
jgi:LysM repeat protein